MSMAAGDPDAAVPSWRGYVGAWLAIGTSPGALVLGSQLSGTNGGALPLLALLLGLVLMGTLLLLQGRLGVARPRGDGQAFFELARSYLGPRSRQLVGALIAGGMAGWVGFNVGIGAESLARLTGVGQVGSALVLGAVVVALAAGPVRLWNRAAIATTLATLALVPLLLVSVDGASTPVRASVGTGTALVADLAAFVGYVAVFAVRAPDFTRGVGRVSDVGRCVGALVVPALLLCVVGAELAMTLGDGKHSATLAGLPALTLGGFHVGDLLVFVAVIAPSVTSGYSGGQALGIFTGAPRRGGGAVLTGIGVVLAAVGFQHDLLPWLGFLAGILPPAAVPFWFAFRHRRTTGRTLRIPWWTWLPASVVGGSLVALGGYGAPLAGLGIALALTAVWRRTVRSKVFPFVASAATGHEAAQQ
jgi:purine-cytosine permease-like protein